MDNKHAQWCVPLSFGIFAMCVTVLFQFVENNKAADLDWFRLESNKDGTRWYGKCWSYVNMAKYEFDVEFDVSSMYPYFEKRLMYNCDLKELTSVSTHTHMR